LVGSKRQKEVIMFKIILCSLAVILIHFNCAFAEVTYSAFTKDGRALKNELGELNVNEMTPLDALAKLNELKKKHGC